MEEMIRRFVVRSQETFYDEHLGEMNNVSHVIYHFQDFNLDFTIPAMSALQAFRFDSLPKGLNFVV